MNIGTNVLSLISSEKLLEQLHEPLSKVYRGRDVEDVLGFKRLLAGHVLWSFVLENMKPLPQFAGFCFYIKVIVKFNN